MVRIAWQSETDISSSLVPMSPISELSPTESVELLFNTWDLSFVTLPGYVVCMAFPSSACLIVSFYRLLLGTLYPAYSSYKAIRNKDVDEYVKWMMYWVVFALFTTAETITDVFFGFWFPFYYEIKIIVVLWLLSPATEGSSILYRKFVHPILVKREKEIDEYLLRAKEESYKTVLELGTKSVQYASRVIMQTAINGGGGLMNTLRKSYSVGDVSNDINVVNRRRVGGGAVLQELDETDRVRARNHLHQQAAPGAVTLDDSDTEEFDDLCDEMMEIVEEQEDIVMRPPVQRAPRARATREVYFTEIDTGNSVPRRGGDEAERYIGEIRSVEDVSSGYSSTEFLPTDTVSGTIEAVIRRSGSVRSSSRTRPVTMVDNHAKPTRNGGASGSDVPSYATLPRSANKKRTVKPK